MRMPTIDRLEHDLKVGSVFVKMPGSQLRLTPSVCSITALNRDDEEEREKGEAINCLWGEQLKFLFKKYSGLVCHFFQGQLAEDVAPWINRQNTIDGALGMCLIGGFDGETYRPISHDIVNLKAAPYIGTFWSRTDWAAVCASVPYYMKGIVISAWQVGKLYKYEQDIEVAFDVKSSIRSMLANNKSDAEVRQYAQERTSQPNKIVADEIARLKLISFLNR